MAKGSSSLFGLEIPKYDGDYAYWSTVMENFLRAKEFWKVVEVGVGEETDLSFKQKKLIDMKAKGLLFQAIDRATLSTIINKDTSKNIWLSMKKKGTGSERVQKAQLQALKREFELLQMKEGERVLDYCMRIMEICTKMRINGDALTDKLIVEKMNLL